MASSFKRDPDPDMFSFKSRIPKLKYLFIRMGSPNICSFSDPVRHARFSNNIPGKQTRRVWANDRARGPLRAEALRVQGEAEVLHGAAAGRVVLPERAARPSNALRLRVLRQHLSKPGVQNSVALQDGKDRSRSKSLLSTGSRNENSAPASRRASPASRASARASSPPSPRPSWPPRARRSARRRHGPSVGIV